MVFMVEPLSISAAVSYASAAFLRWGDRTLHAFCYDVARTTYWYHLYRLSAASNVGMPARKALKLLVQNRPDDTHDTKPPARDTSTIHAMLTMTPAGAFDVDFAAQVIPFPEDCRARSRSYRRALHARDAIHQLRGLRRRS